MIEIDKNMEIEKLKEKLLIIETDKNKEIEKLVMIKDKEIKKLLMIKDKEIEKLEMKSNIYKGLFNKK